MSNNRYARRRPGWKEKNKQIKPSLDKDKVVPEEKERKRIMLERYGIFYDKTNK